MKTVDRALTAAAAGVTSLTLVVHGRVDNLLSALHPVGQPAHGMGDLVPLFELPDMTKAQDVLSVWLSPRAAETGFPDADEVVPLVLGFDTVLALATPVLFWGLLTYLRAHVGSTPATPRRASYLRMVKWARRATPALAAADLVENLGLLLIFEGASDEPWVLRLTWIAMVLKFALLAAIAVPCVATAGWLALGTPATRRRSLRTLAAVRVHVVLVVLSIALLLGPVSGPQTADVLLRWVDEPADGVIGVCAVLWLAAALYVSCRWLVAREQTNEPSELPLWVVPAIGGALLVIGLAFSLVTDQLAGLWPLGGILVLIGGLSWPVRELDDLPGRTALTTPPAVLPTLAPALVAAAALFVAGIAIVRAAVVERVYAGDQRYVLVILAGLGLVSLGSVLLGVGRRAPGAPGPLGWTLIIAGSLGSAVITWRVLRDPWRTADVLGLLGIFGVFAGLLAILGLAVVSLEHRWRPPPAAAALGAQRLPLLAILIAWSLAAAIQDKGGYHDARVLQGEAVAQTLTVEDAWKRWKSREWPKSEKDRAAVPLVLVAASGGGIRAAYWTALAMDCAIDGGRASGNKASACGEPRGNAHSAVFAVSGVSGGGVGLTEWTAHHYIGERDADWVDRHLGEDFLAPAWAWALLADLPSALLHVDFGPDRAEVLERGWEQTWRTDGQDARSFISGEAPSSSGPLAVGLRDAAAWEDLPLLVLSATSVRDGCRINVSALDIARTPQRGAGCLSPENAHDQESSALAATHDLFDTCGRRDLRLSTAALLSARFPLVSSSGRLGPPSCEQPSLFAVDGGYFDNSATSTVSELWTHLEPLVDRFNRRSRDGCVVPFLLQLDNHYSDERPADEPKRPFELEAPLRTITAARSAREEGARQAAALAFGAPSFGSIDGAYLAGKRRQPILSRYAHLYPRAHPGTTAPLGWTLSRPSRQSLREQLISGDNRSALDRIRRWFSGRLHCPRLGERR